jgi:hypothetical protein
MKKILVSSLIISILTFSLTSCLKDKGFENNEYGINDPDTQPPGVGFPFGSRAKNDLGVDVSGSPQTFNGLVYVNLEAGNPASSDVQVTLTNNTTALLNAYNTANGTSIQALPTALYTIAPSLTIPAGARNNEVPIVISSTLSLNPNIQYAIGLTISAVSGNYKIAENLKNLFVVIGVKNKYDGKYTMKGQFYHPSLQPDFGPHNFSVELHTSGPNSVRLYWPLVGGYNTPLTSGGGPACCFTAQELSLVVNTTTNAVTVVNSAVGAGITYQQVTGFGANTYNNRWNDASKTFYAAWGYNLPASGVINTPPGTSARAWIDTLIRTGPR